MAVSQPRLWSLEEPNCYTVRAALLRNGQELDCLESACGFRTVELSPEDGLLLNHKRVVLHGVCLHHDLGCLGAAFSRPAARRQLEILQTARQLASQGRAVALILHDIALALERADRVAVLREGELICADTPEAVFRSGLLGKTFRVGLHRMETPHGMRYYYTEEAE